MRKICGILLVLMPFLATAQAGKFNFQGKIGNLNAPAKLYFDYMYEGDNRSDSCVLKNGVFAFSGMTDGPATARLIMDYTGHGLQSAATAGNILIIYIDKGTIKAESKDSLQHLRFINSPINDEYRSYNQQIGGTMQDISARMNAKVAAATPEQRNDTAFFSSLNREFKSLIDARTAEQWEFIKQHPDSYFSMVALSEAAGSFMDVSKVEPIFNSLSAEVKKTSDGKAFANRIHAAKTTAIGSIAPDFTQNDVDGKPVSLSDFRGKYVLLDFWASWCGPCRAENPNVVKDYNRFKEKNFTVLGVSLDNQKQQSAWLAAIKKDGLIWPNVSDLKGWNNAVAVMYGVRAVPQNFLIDPQGKIIAVNLRGEELTTALEKFLGE